MEDTRQLDDEDLAWGNAQEEALGIRMHQDEDSRANLEEDEVHLLVHVEENMAIAQSSFACQCQERQLLQELVGRQQAS